MQIDLTKCRYEGDSHISHNGKKDENKPISQGPDKKNFLMGFPTTDRKTPISQWKKGQKTISRVSKKVKKNLSDRPSKNRTEKNQRHANQKGKLTQPPGVPHREIFTQTNFFGHHFFSTF